MTAEAPERRSTLLNQILAVRQSVRGDVEVHVNKAKNLFRQQPLMSGFARSYQPKDDEDFKFPDETAQVQIKATQILGMVAVELTKLFDITAAMDWTNQHARANIVVMGPEGPVTLVADVPVHYLLFLEKQLVGLEDMIRKLPILPSTEAWNFDPATDMFKSIPVGTIKTKKVRRSHVLVPATDRHPAQVEPYTEDEPIGTWTTVKFSGALPAERVNEMLNRVTALSQAVKFAREQANMEDVINPKPGKKILDYLFA